MYVNELYGRVFLCPELDGVEAWLDEHPAFVADYFARKASRAVVDQWLQAHAAPPTPTTPPSEGHALPAGRGQSSTAPVRKISAHEFERSDILRYSYIKKKLIHGQTDRKSKYVTLKNTALTTATYAIYTCRCWVIRECRYTFGEKNM